MPERKSFHSQKGIASIGNRALKLPVRRASSRTLKTFKRGGRGLLAISATLRSSRTSLCGPLDLLDRLGPRAIGCHVHDVKWPSRICARRYGRIDYPKRVPKFPRLPCLRASSAHSTDRYGRRRTLAKLPKNETHPSTLLRWCYLPLALVDLQDSENEHMAGASGVATI